MESKDVEFKSSVVDNKNGTYRGEQGRKMCFDCLASGSPYSWFPFAVRMCEGKFVRTWESKGSGQGQFSNPTGVAVSGSRDGSRRSW